MDKNPSNGPKKTRGGILILVVTMLVALCGFAALSVDLGLVFVVRSQLQNAADSAALTGVGYLYPSNAAGTPNWSLAQTKALSIIPLNKAEGVPLISGDIVTGYWNMTGINSGLNPSGSVRGPNDVPAIQVTVSKSAGKNGGPVNLFFGPAVGIKTMNIGAKAIAISGSPSSVGIGDLFPIALAKSLYDTYWDSTTGSPKIDPSTGNPYIFHVAAGPGGEWTSFNTSANDVPTVINFILNGNPISYYIGDNIWISPGVKTSIYASVPTNKDVLMAIVPNITTHSLQPIIAFGAVHIDFGVGGNSKYVQIHFIKDYKAINSNPGGPNYGAYTPPRLVK